MIEQWCGFLQEWANANCVALPVRNDRANTTSYYRFEEEVPSNILQARPSLSVRRYSCPDQGTSPMRAVVSRSSAPGQLRFCSMHCRWVQPSVPAHLPCFLLQGHDEIVWAVEVAGHRLFSASADKTIRVWDIESRRCERVLEDHSRPVLSLACSDGKLFSGSYDYTIKVLAAASML